MCAIVDNPLAVIDGPVFRKRAGKTMLGIMAGNHRVNAASEAGVVAIGGYIVTCDDKQANIFIRSDNRASVRPQSDAEADQHIHYLHQEYGVPLAEAARKFSRPAETVQQQNRANRVKKELESLNVNTDNLAVATLIKLHTLVHDKDIFVRAASLASVYGMRVEDVDGMVTTLKGSRSAALKSTVLDNWENRLKNNIPQPKTKRQLPAKKRLLNLLSANTGGLLRLLLNGHTNNTPITDINSIGFSIDDAEQLVSLWDQIVTRMTPLLNQSQSWINQGKTKQTKQATRPVRQKKRKGK